MCWSRQACCFHMPAVFFFLFSFPISTHCLNGQWAGQRPPFLACFCAMDNTTSLNSSPLCAMNIYFFAHCLNSSAPKSVTRDLIKLHLITQGCPSGLTPSFPEEFSPDLLNSSKTLSGRPLVAVPCECWVTGIYAVF